MPNQGHPEAHFRSLDLLPSKVDGILLRVRRDLWTRGALPTKASSPGYFWIRNTCPLITDGWATKLVFVVDIQPVETGPFQQFSNLLLSLQLRAVRSNQGRGSPSPLPSPSLLSLCWSKLVELDDTGFGSVHLGFSCVEIQQSNKSRHYWFH